MVLTKSVEDTIIGRIKFFSEKTPDKNAIIINHSSITYKTLFEQLSAFAHQLRQLKLSEYDRIGIAVSNKYQFLVSLISGMAIGAVPVPFSTDNEDVITATAADCKPQAIICDASTRQIVGKSRHGAETIDLDDIEAGTIKDVELFRACGSDDAMMFYTSGTTTGVKTGIRISYDNLNNTVRYMNTFMGITSDIVEYAIAPIHHAFGFGRCRAIFQAGGTIVLDDGVFNPAKVLLALEKYECNALSSVSTGITLLLDNFESFFRKTGPNLSWMEIGSMPLSSDQKTKVLEVCPNAKVFMNYGLTEAMRSTLIEMRSEYHRIKTVGKASPGLQIKITDAENVSIPSGESGSIWVKGGNVAKGLWGKDELWAQRYREGWLKTGDMGSLDEEGYLTFIGRSDDIINTGGKKFSPVEVEEVLKPQFKDTVFCICGIKDPDGVLGEIPVLFLEGQDEKTLSEIIEPLRKSLDEYKVPKQIIVLNEIPKTENGKIQRVKLKTIYNMKENQNV